MVRLGANTTSQLVLSFVMRDLFRAKTPVVRERMTKLWEHSIDVAAISFILARKIGGFDPERALLAGLVHDIGVVAILIYADEIKALKDFDVQIGALIAEYRGEIGAAILRQWNFPEDFVLIAREAEEWRRDPAERPDYCDLVMVAQLHSFTRSPGMVLHPPIFELPAFNKLGQGGLTPQSGLEILQEAEEQIEQTRALLAA